MEREDTNIAPNPTNNANNNNNNKGLTSRGPLVTMSSTTPASSAVSVQINKPRTVPPPPPPLPPPPPSLSSAGTTIPPANVPIPPVTATAHTSSSDTTPKRGNNSPSKRKALVRNALNKFNTSSNSNKGTSNNAGNSAKVSSTSTNRNTVGPSSLEVEADKFFSSVSEEGHTYKRPPLFSLKEVTFVSDSAAGDDDTMPLIRRLWHLCYRRAWSDVLQVSNELLTSSTSPYSHTYQYCLLATTPATTVSEYPTVTKSNDIIMQQTCEILAWRWIAFGKLRRRYDLKRDIERVQDTIMNNNKNDDAPQIPPLIQIHLAHTLIYLMDYTDGNISDDDKSLKKENDIVVDDSGVLINDIFYKLLDQQQSQVNGSPFIVARLHLALIHSSLSSSSSYSHNNYRIALFHIQALFEHLQSHQSLFSNPDDTNNPNGFNLWTLFQFEICSLHGHILLQLGAIDEAAHILNKCASFNNSNSLPLSYKTKIQVHNGLLQFANNNYKDAFQQFSRAIQILQQQEDDKDESIDNEEQAKVVDPLIVSVQDNWCTLFPSVQHATSNKKSNKSVALDHLFSSACNNLALTALYTCRMTEAVQVLEDLIRTDPTIFLTETIAFNLCTLYELGHDIQVSERKKRILQLIAKRFYLHDLGSAECFRLS